MKNTLKEDILKEFREEYGNDSDWKEPLHILGKSIETPSLFLTKALDRVEEQMRIEIIKKLDSLLQEKIIYKGEESFEAGRVWGIKEALEVVYQTQQSSEVEG